MPVHADDLPNPARYDFRAAAVEIDTAELRVGGRRHADIARCTDVEIELVVGTDGEEFPAVRLVLGQIVVDNDWLRRVIEVVLDLLNLRDLRELGDVEGAVGESEAVRPIEARVERLDLAPASLVSDGVDLVQKARADKYGALVALAQGTRIGETARIGFDLKALGRFQLLGRYLDGRRWMWRRYDRCELGPNCRLRPALRPGRRGFRRCRWLLRGCRHRDSKRCDGSSEQQKMSTRAFDHDDPPLRRPFSRRRSRRR